MGITARQIMTDYAHIPFEPAKNRILRDSDPRFVTMLERGSLSVELYRPVKQDHQQPHTRDECYVILDGCGLFDMGDETIEFRPGDFIFVAADIPHRFRDFGETMTTWVIFYGPEGGEAAD